MLTSFYFNFTGMRTESLRVVPENGEKKTALQSHAI